MKIRTKEKCEICGGTFYAKGLCKFHYDRKRKGISQDFPLLKRENRIEIIGDVALVEFYDKMHNPIGNFKIDKEDIEKIKDYKWSYISAGYIVTYKNKKPILLHRLLANCPDDKVVDHINHDKLDNRKNNLRVCTSRQNNINKRSQSNTGEFGICFSNGYYHIQIDGKYCGVAKTLEEAIEIRNKNLIGTEVQKFNNYL